MADLLERAYDITIFGASGFTGAYVVLELARVMDASADAPTRAVLPRGARLRVALAGRSLSRLQEVLSRTREAYPSFSAALVIADVNDAASLRACAASTVLLLSCAGPFRTLGEPVVAACVAARTSYADVTGEPEFMERCELLHHEAAVRAGVRVVSCCGFDSIPADLGVAFASETLRARGGVATAVESFLTVRGGPDGIAGHYATFASAVLGFGSVAALRSVRRSYAAAHPGLLESVCAWGAPLPRRGTVSWVPSEGRFALPFPGSDASVVKRTQRSLVAAGAARAGKGSGALDDAPPPIAYGAYFTLPSRWAVAMAMLVGGVMQTLAQWQWGRALLLRYPRFFTLGLFSHEGPTPAQLAAASFAMTFYAQGYSQGASARTMLAAGGRSGGSGGGGGRSREGGTAPADLNAVVRVSGPEPGYVATPKILLSAAFTILDDVRAAAGGAAAASLSCCGLLTPAAAFRGPSGVALRERLQVLGIAFDVLDADRNGGSS